MFDWGIFAVWSGPTISERSMRSCATLVPLRVLQRCMTDSSGRTSARTTAMSETFEPTHETGRPTNVMPDADQREIDAQTG